MPPRTDRRPPRSPAGRLTASLIHNVHERELPYAPAVVGQLIDGLAQPENALWPAYRWPAQHFDRGLDVGSRGGHGPIRYSVSAHIPGRAVEFTFSAPAGLIGRHRFEIVELAPSQTIVRHVVSAHTLGTMRLAWPLLWGPMHDALLEDGLDQAAWTLAGEDPRPRRLTRYVQALRWIGRRRAR